MSSTGQNTLLVWHFSRKQLWYKIGQVSAQNREFACTVWIKYHDIYSRITCNTRNLQKFWWVCFMCALTSGWCEEKRQAKGTMIEQTERTLIYLQHINNIDGAKSNKMHFKTN
jgi:hypothetical protein